MQPKAKIRVVLVEDHPMVREHLAHLLSLEPDMAVCGEADNIQQALQIIQATRPDIAVRGRAQGVRMRAIASCVRTRAVSSRAENGLTR